MTRKTVSLYVDTDHWKLVEQVAKKRGTGQSKFLEDLIDQWKAANPREAKEALEAEVKEAEALDKTEKLLGGYGFTVDIDVIKKFLKEKKDSEKKGKVTE